MIHCILSVKHVRLREPVFLFLTCLKMCIRDSGTSISITNQSAGDQLLSELGKGAIQGVSQ